MKIFHKEAYVSVYIRLHSTKNCHKKRFVQLVGKKKYEKSKYDKDVKIQQYQLNDFVFLKNLT